MCIGDIVFFQMRERSRRKERVHSLYHTIVLDCAPITFVDSTGIAMLEQVRGVMEE